MKTLEGKPSDKEGKQEILDEAVISHNILEMNSSMLTLLIGESIGGNAEKVKIDGERYPCAAICGYADYKSGKILMFEDWQDVGGDVRDNNPEFKFRVALDLRAGVGRGFFKIVDIFGLEKFSEVAQKVIRVSVERWNTARA